MAEKSVQQKLNELSAINGVRAVLKDFKADDFQALSVHLSALAILHAHQLDRLRAENAELLDQNERVARANDKLRACQQAPLPEEVAKLLRKLNAIVHNHGDDPFQPRAMNMLNDCLSMIERLARSVHETRREALEDAAKTLEARGRAYVEKWHETEMDNECKSYGWDCLQHAIAIRAIIESAETTATNKGSTNLSGSRGAQTTRGQDQRNGEADTSATKSAGQESSREARSGPAGGKGNPDPVPADQSAGRENKAGQAPLASDSLSRGLPNNPAPADSLEKDLAYILNRRSEENVSNTPDFILAQFLEACLLALNTAIQQRETWYGRDARPSTPADRFTDKSTKPQGGTNSGPTDTRVCWAPGIKCQGCAHYYGKADRCEFAPAVPNAAPQANTASQSHIDAPAVAAPTREDTEDMSGPSDEEDAHAAPQVAAQATSAPQSQVQHPGPAVAAPLPRKTLALADKIIGDYKEHYSFPLGGESHMHDCIVDDLRGLDGPSENEVGAARDAQVEKHLSQRERILCTAVLRWHEGRKKP